MTPKALPTEFTINMFLDKIMILQQSELPNVNSHNYFDEHSPCHIYFICRRPRVTIKPDSFTVNKESITMTFRVQKKDIFEEFSYTFKNQFQSINVSIESAYPYSVFAFIRDGEKVLTCNAAVFLQSVPRYYTNAEFLDLEILYIGQSYGVEGARTAPDRLKSHSTLQGIYAEAIQKNPDCEIWLALTSFQQLNLMMFDGRTKFTEQELMEDKERFRKVHHKLNYEGINEQQKINFTEAALIKYFQPPYNIEYKSTFPNPAHKTYAECYELDINSVAIELDTYESLNCYLYSEAANTRFIHMQHFFLHSHEERRSMFDIDALFKKKD
jgi:hypothetical protein